MDFMDLLTRFSTVQVVNSTALNESIISFKSNWVSHFWCPEAIRGDRAFCEGEFNKYIDHLDIKFELVPNGRHYKNAIESKNNVIRSMFIRLTEEDNNELDILLAAYKAVSISNTLYGNNALSAFDMAKGFSKPVDSVPQTIPEELLEAQKNSTAERKLAAVLKSKSITDIELSVGDLVEICQIEKGTQAWKMVHAKEDIIY